MPTFRILKLTSGSISSFFPSASAEVSCGRFAKRNELAKFPHVLLLQGVVQLSRRIFLPFPFASDHIISFSVVIYKPIRFSFLVPHFVSLTPLLTQSGFSLSPVSAILQPMLSYFSVIEISWLRIVQSSCYHAINLMFLLL